MEIFSTRHTIIGLKRTIMCFSPEASFTATAVLVTAGIVAIKEAKFTNKITFAVIPILFAVQQFAEGMLWLALQNPDHDNWRKQSTYMFLIFAQVVWPFWVPFSIYLMEKKQHAKNILKILSITGALLSIYLLFRIIVSPITASIDCNHIYYNLDVPKYSLILVDIFYLVFVILPPFISSARKTSLLGVIIVISLIITEIFYTKALISVWCFFAAILSVVVIYVLRKMPRQQEKDYKDFHSY